MSDTTFARARQARCLVMVTLAAALAGGAATRLAGQEPPAGRPSQTAAVDVVALDAQGRPVTTLAPADVHVVIDGNPRPVVSLRYVFRGAGAAAAAKAGSGLSGAAMAADPSRLVFVAVDEHSFGPGAERAIVSAVGQIGDMLAPADRVGLVALPDPGRVTASSDRKAFRQALAGIRGRATTIDASAAEADRRRVADDLRSPETSQGRDARDDPAGRTETTRERPASPTAGLLEDEIPLRDAAASRRTSMPVFANWLRSLAEVQGPKTVIFVWGGTWSSESADRDHGPETARDIDAAVAAAAASRTIVHVVALARSERARPDAAMSRLAGETGGVLVTVSPKRTSVERLAAAMAGSYLVEVEERDGDRAGLHTLEVATTRPGVEVLAAGRWAARDDPRPSPVERAPAPAAAPTASTTRRDRPTAGGPPPDAEMEAVVARASEYLASYLQEFSSVVAEEEYTQTAVDSRPRGGLPGPLGLARESVRLRSDLLLLRAEADADWIPFRDVFEVDGKPVRDREDRLRALFLESPETAMQEGLRITQEGSRFNVGQVERTINTPTMGLFFLLPRERPRLRFARGGEHTVEGLRVWRIDFEETEGPTLIRESTTGKDLPSTGSLWIEPATGRVVKTLIRGGDVGLRMEISTTFRRSESLSLWVPAEMRETFWLRSGTYRITGLARYGKFRRFDVSTDEKVTVPKE